MSTTTPTRETHRRFADPIRSERRTSQLEEARQLRDAVAIQIEIAAATGQCSISMTIDDAAALERLLSDSIDTAEAMGAT